MLRNIPLRRLGLCWLLPMFIIFLTSCSVQQKLIREYKGENMAMVLSKIGNPTKVEELPGGSRVIFYEKKIDLSKVSINTGQFRHDQLESPGVTKIEMFRFFINSSGIVEDVDYEYKYER